MSAKIQIVSFESICGNVTVPNEIWRKTAEEFGAALRNTGFVYLSNHGIPQSVIDNVFNSSREFFHLPLETKKMYPRDMNGNFHGYTPVGNESFSNNKLAELRETFDISVENTLELKYPDNEVAEFRPSIDILLEECENLSKKMLRLLALAMNMEDEEFFLKCHRIVSDHNVSNYTQLRTLYYPPVPEDVLPGSVRCGAHTDFGTFTLLFQDTLGGLELKTADGWVPAIPIPGCIVVNTGDLLHYWSGGYFPSTFHRVIIPEEEIKKQKPRQCIAYFVKPDNDYKVRPVIEKDSSSLKGAIDHSQEYILPGEHYLKRTALAFSGEAAPVKG